MQEGQISYIHFGNESASDEFLIMATLDEFGRVSKPCVMVLAVTPVNDQPPRVTTNTGLTVSTGAEVPITVDHLNITDLDTPPSELVFIISQPTNGDIVRSPDKKTLISNFTQQDINDGLIFYQHKGMQFIIKSVSNVN